MPITPEFAIRQLNRNNEEALMLLEEFVDKEIIANWNGKDPITIDSPSSKYIVKEMLKDKYQKLGWIVTVTMNGLIFKLPRES